MYTRKGVFYLNNTGSKWVVFTGNLRFGRNIKEKVYVKINGELLYVTAQYYSSFGNFAACRINYKGTKRDVLSFTHFAAQINQLDNIVI